MSLKAEINSQKEREQRKAETSRKKKKETKFQVDLQLCLWVSVRYRYKELRLNEENALPASKTTNNYLIVRKAILETLRLLYADLPEKQ